MMDTNLSIEAKQRILPNPKSVIAQTPKSKKTFKSIHIHSNLVMYMTDVSLEMVYRELKDMRKEIELIMFALLPEETLNKDEIKEILHIEKEMKQGKKIILEDALKEI